MTATRTHLLEWVHTLGIEVLQAVFAAEAEALAGPKGRHPRERTHHHWERTATELTFGGRRIQVARPRVRSCKGQEAVLPAVAAWRGRDPLTARVLEQVLLGVSKALGNWLESNGHVDAAASLREGLEETLTVLTLGLPTRLQRFFATTN